MVVVVVVAGSHKFDNLLSRWHNHIDKVDICIGDKEYKSQYYFDRKIERYTLHNNSRHNVLLGDILAFQRYMDLRNNSQVWIHQGRCNSSVVDVVEVVLTSI